MDYFIAALDQAAFPIAINRADARTFNAEVYQARLGALGVCRAVASAHSGIRGTKEVAATGSDCFSLMLTLRSSWTTDQNDPCRMQPRDVFITDSRYPRRINMENTYSGIRVLAPAAWMRQWLPNPSVLAGRRIPANSLWGAALTSYLSQLSPDLVAAPPLPAAIIADQLGALLALTAMAVGGIRSGDTQATRSLLDRMQDCLAQRCTEPHLTAADIAAAMQVSVRTLHRSYAAANTTFGAKLIEARMRAALHMLTSQLFKRLTTAQIGRRAGFLSASHFARIVRNRTGQTPLQLRRAAFGDKFTDPST